ncbi:MAG TPA: 16S rRNA (guanine(527)-N(7))-methyltransferase RsmG [Firmicutes bacterium]|nr:16S rRNA (guanine(527)-N(7))-methyltransferase RsmG [Bacillota bacterium]
MNKEQFIIELKKLNIELTEDQLKKLEIYCNYLLEYNEHTNLTAIKDKEGVYLKHFYDSITFIKALDLKEYKTLLDIGTGAGFPGLVLKILYPHLEVTLLDSNNKKIKFLESLITKLNITGITLYNGRAEDYCKQKREYFDIVTGRAVSNMNILSEISLPFVKLTGYFIAMKGQNKEEIEDSKDAIQILGGKIENIINFLLPIEESERNIIKTKKISNTPNEYPRRYEKIVKNPLKKKRK